MKQSGYFEKKYSKAFEEFKVDEKISKEMVDSIMRLFKSRFNFMNKYLEFP